MQTFSTLAGFTEKLLFSQKVLAITDLPWHVIKHITVGTTSGSETQEVTILRPNLKGQQAVPAKVMHTVHTCLCMQSHAHSKVGLPIPTGLQPIPTGLQPKKEFATESS